MPPAPRLLATRTVGRWPVSWTPPCTSRRCSRPVTTLTTGFALVVQPIEAQTTIATDTNGLLAGEVQIPVSDGEIPAYRAMPEDGKSLPVVLVVQEIFMTRTAELAGYQLRLNRITLDLNLSLLSPKVIAHEGELTQVLLNLIINAIHAISAVRASGSGVRRFTTRWPERR